ncbi:hypothetical protein EMPS_07569 [Entomortierella parvispora]|uniref:FAD-binding FR-type domain-containing protein n=1 Tax=Entomortierella parvispora TaxID=205924 RepID=A0A9P3HEP9_9FUNG|nr:hypothetical protein EMPS_07569 [Entomortierella parvispora]
MTNPAVAKWLEEIASAKAKAQAKTPKVSPLNTIATDNGSKVALSGSQSNDLSKGKTIMSASPYGIFPLFDLKTRKKQLRLVLPPPPTKPGPGECCGNDCNPCINTLYQEDLAEHQERVRNLKAAYEHACLELERGKEQDDFLPAPSSPLSTKSTAIVLEDKDQKTGGMSLRSYRPFKILRKDYLNDNTLLVVCDTPMPSPRGTPTEAFPPAVNRSGLGDGPLESMFHILIRFRNGSDDYLTKAFTPVALKAEGDRKDEGMEGKLTFMIKLYPTPHLTSDMFRRLRVGPEGDDSSMLYLRGPIHTSRTPLKDGSIDTIPLPEAARKTRARNHRIVMIAAGSGITPMYQLLQRLHHDEMQADRHGNSRQEIDLIYCNRTKNDIWLRQELQQLKTDPAIADESPANPWRRRTVRIQHVLSSSLSNHPDEKQEEEYFHSGRITLDLLRDTLQHSLQKEPVAAEDDTLQILICGPPSFNTDVSRMLLQLGYSSSSLENRCEIHILE